MSDPDAEPHTTQPRMGRGAPLAPRPVDRAPGDLVERLSVRLRDEVDATELPLPSGATVTLVALDEVQQWLLGVAIRLRAGERL